MQLKNSVFVALAAIMPGLALGDDGIWLFNEFPRAAIRAKYGFDASVAFLKKLQT